MAAALGAAAMAIGAVGPWALAHTAGGQVAAAGLHHGSVLILVASAGVALFAAVRQRPALAVCAAAAALWTALVMYSLPGTLIDQGAGEANLAWGAYLALAGALTALVAAAVRPAGS
jgi:hypothetical protein